MFRINYAIVGLVLCAMLESTSAWSVNKTTVVRFSSFNDCVDADKTDDIVIFPVRVIHAIPLDHAGIEKPHPLAYFTTRSALWPPLEFNVGSPNADGTTAPMKMADVTFRGDNKPVLAPDKFDPALHTFRANSDICILFNKETKEFSFANKEEDMAQPGLAESFERRTSLDNTLTCYRKDTFGDGSCLTQSSIDDFIRNVPEKLSWKDAAFDDYHRKFEEVGEKDSGITELVLRMENNMPLVTIEWDVDWLFVLRLDFTDSNFPRYTLTGGHDSFPLYEVFIGNQKIYSYDGVLAGNDVTDLQTPISAYSFLPSLESLREPNQSLSGNQQGFIE